jgi:hypothetical protein
MDERPYRGSPSLHHTRSMNEGRTTRPWPRAARVLYPLGLLAIPIVVMVLAFAASTPVAWGLLIVPASLLAAGSLAVRRAERTSRSA